jgi:CrcB protein
MRFLWVGLGGGVGSVVRYAIGVGAVYQRFPWSTMAINLVGAFFLGLLLTLGVGRIPIAVLTPLAVGLLGGFTTFSAFAWEAFTMGRGGQMGWSLAYAVGSVVGGWLLAWLGYGLGQALR